MKLTQHTVLLFMGLICVPALGQTANLSGSWELTGWRCEDDKKLVPVEGSLQEMVFRSDGTFRHSYIEVPDPNEEIEFERFLEEKRERAEARQERDEEAHEEQCQRSEREDFRVENEEGEDLCTPAAKRKLYEKWWSSRAKELEEEIELANRTRPGSNGICKMILNGSYQADGRQMTIQFGTFESTTACGTEAGYPQGRMSIRYYLEGEDIIYFVQSANENSREYCGSSDWSEIMIRK